MSNHADKESNVSADGPVQFAGRLTLDRSVRGNLVNQIVEQIAALVASGKAPPLERMPSVRSLAGALAVSTFSVVEAYDRLVALGHLISRRGAGYYVAPRRIAKGDKVLAPAAQDDDVRLNASALLEPELFSSQAAGITVQAGSPYLPSDWYDAKWLQDCGRTALRSSVAVQPGFTHRMGLVDLRRQIARSLAATGIEIGHDDVLITQSAAHGIDLTLRALARPGDAVLIEDPSYTGLLPLIKQHGCEALPVPRKAGGIDLACLQALAQAKRPKLAFITTVMHNPLGVTLSAHQAYQLLALAERFDFRIIEDDVFRALAEPRDPSLAALDGLRRVIRIDGTSKFLPWIGRIGSVVAAPEILATISRVKMIAGLACSEFSEKLALHVLSSSEFRRHIVRVKARLDAGREATLELLAAIGLQVLALPHGGPFVCAGLPSSPWSGMDIARFALDHGVVLSPSLRFTRSDGDAPWFRFNVACSAHPHLRKMFDELMRHAPAATPNAGGASV
jgi:DNA-binding transcriptional MocR family regulator